jgi:hypothetical protein
VPKHQNIKKQEIRIKNYGHICVGHIPRLLHVISRRTRTIDFVLQWREHCIKMWHRVTKTLLHFSTKLRVVILQNKTTLAVIVFKHTNIIGVYNFCWSPGTHPKSIKRRVVTSAVLKLSVQLICTKLLICFCTIPWKLPLNKGSLIYMHLDFAMFITHHQWNT